MKTGGFSGCIWYCGYADTGKLLCSETRAKLVASRIPISRFHVRKGRYNVRTGAKCKGAQKIVPAGAGFVGLRGVDKCTKLYRRCTRRVKFSRASGSPFMRCVERFERCDEKRRRR